MKYPLYVTTKQMDLIFYGFHATKGMRPVILQIKDINKEIRQMTGKKLVKSPK